MELSNVNFQIFLKSTYGNIQKGKLTFCEVYEVFKLEMNQNTIPEFIFRQNLLHFNLKSVTYGFFVSEIICVGRIFRKFMLQWTCSYLFNFK